MDNEIDYLMDLDLDGFLAATPADIEKLVARYRSNRAQLESGFKPRKEAGPALKIDAAAIGIAPKADPDFKRRY